MATTDPVMMPGSKTVANPNGVLTAAATDLIDDLFELGYTPIETAVKGMFELVEPTTWT